MTIRHSGNTDSANLYVVFAHQVLRRYWRGIMFYSLKKHISVLLCVVLFSGTISLTGFGGKAKAVTLEKISQYSRIADVGNRLQTETGTVPVTDAGGRIAVEKAAAAETNIASACIPAANTNVESEPVNAGAVVVNTMDPSIEEMADRKAVISSHSANDGNTGELAGAEDTGIGSEEVINNAVAEPARDETAAPGRITQTTPVEPGEQTVAAMAAGTTGISVTETIENGLRNSGMKTAASVLEEKADTPGFTPASGTYIESQLVTISCSTSGAAIYYTTDGTTPSALSAEYAEPITVAGTCTIKAIAVKDGMADSDIACTEFIIQLETKTIKSDTTLNKDEVYGILNIQNGVFNINGNTVIVNGDVNIRGGSIDLGGGILTVRGSINQSAGLLDINNGKLYIENDYTVTDGDSEKYLKMANEFDYIYIGGNFFVHKYVYQGMGGMLTAGTIELMGDFTQRDYNGWYNDFVASGTHRVLLSGDSLQKIDFDKPGSNCFNILEIKHSLGIGVDFVNSLNAATLITNGCVLPSLIIDIMSWKLTANEIVDGSLTVSKDINLNGKTLEVRGNLYYSNGTINLEGSNLTVKGSINQSAGLLDINNGKLYIENDYTVTNGGTGKYLKMTNESDYIYIGGNFFVHKYVYQGMGGMLTAGTIELKGDFTQRDYNGWYNDFVASGTHRVILSGNAVQKIDFDKPGNNYFNVLEIKHSTGVGVNFVNSLNAATLITNGCVLPALNVNVFAWNLNRDEIVDGNLSMNKDINLNGNTLEVRGDLNCPGGSIDLGGGNLIVRGSVNQGSGLLTINNGKLHIDHDYSITGAGTGKYLKMTNESDYIYIGGNFFVHRYVYSGMGGMLTAGTIEVKGDFTQRDYNGWYNDFVASGTHRVILSGDSLQKVDFEKPSSNRFNALILTKPFDSGYAFSTIPVWNRLIESYRYQSHFGKSSKTGAYAPTGNFSRTYTDMTVASPGFELNFTRTYNSRDEKSTTLGKGWVFGFEGSIKNYENCQNIKMVRMPDGCIFTFNKNVDGTYTANDSRNRLEKLADNTHLLTTKDQYVYTFNTDGCLTKMQDRNGNVVTIHVDASGKVLSITDQAERIYSLTYENGNIKTITDPAGRAVSYEYENGRLARAIDPMGGTTRYSYDVEGYLSEIRDHDAKLAEQVIYDHTPGDNQHKVSQTTDAYGNAHTYAYDNLSGKTVITDSSGRQTTQWYDSSYSVTNNTDQEGKATLAEYFKDSNGINKYWEEKSATDRNGNKTQYQRDTNGNITQIINPDNSTKTMTYDSRNNLISEKDEQVKCTFYIYDVDMKNLLKKAQPLNGTDIYTEGCDELLFAITLYTYYTDTECQQLGYKARGLLKNMTDPEEDITNYTYYPDGNVKTVSDPETGLLTTYEYNSIGWKTAGVSPMGYRTEYTYDPCGRLERTILHGGETTRTTFDMTGRKTKEVSPNLYDSSLDSIAGHTYSGNHGYRYTYYDNGKINTETDSENNTYTYTYDIYGNKLTEVNPDGGVYRYEYDVMNRIQKVFFKGSASSDEIILEKYSYEILSGGKTKRTHTLYLNDTETAVTVCTYDYAGREITKQNPDGAIQSTAYYANGTVSSATDARGSATYYRYDGQNRLNEQWTPVESSLYVYKKITYDKAGRQKQIKVGKELVSLYSFPATFALTSYDYYRNGNVKSVTDGEGRRKEYRYDSDGYVSAEETYTTPTEKNTVEYINNHLGKPVQKKVHVRKGDISGYSFDNDEDLMLVTAFTYDKNGNVKTQTDPGNVTTTFTYDQMNRTTGTSVPGTDESGSPVNITTATEYNWEGNIVYEWDANGNMISYIYDSRGFPETVTDAESGTIGYWYDHAGRKLAEVAPANYDAAKDLSQMNRTQFAYDKTGRVITQTQTYCDTATQQWVSYISGAYKYDANGNVIKELDALGYEAGTGATPQDKINTGHGTEYTYDLANRPITVKDPVSGQRGLSYTVKYGYDTLGRKISETDTKGAIKAYYYDDAGNLLQATIRKTLSDPEKLIETNTYDLTENLITGSDGNSNTTVYEYTALGKVRRTVYPGDTTIPSNTVTFQYDNVGNLITQQDSLGTTDEYTYDAQDRVLSHMQKKQDGTQSITTSIAYDKNGNIRFETDGNGNTTQKTYDGLNRLKTVSVTVSGIVQTTGYEYDANGNLLEETDWRGNKKVFVYDPLNRLTEKKDAYGVSIEKIEYNHNNAQIKSIDALGNLTQYEYDRNNRLLKTIDPLGHETSQTYDNVGNIGTKKDGRNNTTTYTYDEYNRLISVKNAKNETTQYTYDANGNLLTQSDGKGNVTTYEYNAANKAIRKINNGGRTGQTGSYTYDNARVEAYTYYADGSLATKTDRNGNTSNYVYDCHGRLVSETAGGVSITYTYDGNGNQLTMADSTGTTVRTYDALNRVLTKAVPNIGTSTYGYDIISGVEAGCIKETATDPRGNVTEKVYDKAGRLWKVSADGQITTYEYYDNGSRKNVIYPGGAREDYTYYNDGLLWTLTNKKSDGTVLDSYSYEYDAAHNQTQKTDGKGITTYTYDALNRLLTVTEPAGKCTTYAYDAAGNRISETTVLGANTTATTYTYNNQNCLTGTTTKLNNITTETSAYGYDNNGNTLTVTKTSYIGGVAQPVQVTAHAYDLRNQLISTQTPESSSISNTYNGEGLRVSKSVNGVLTRYLYEYDKVVLELDGSGNQSARNVYGTNLLMRSADGTTYYYMYNGHADVTALIKPDGTIAATYYYDSFGSITDTTGYASNSITFAGCQYDSETGLYYLNARMYDPATARFLQEDTYTGDPNDPLSLNLYTYCYNNPLIYHDPTGHWPEWLDKAWNATTDWVTDRWNETKEGWEALNDPQKRAEAFELIDEYGDLEPVEKRVFAVSTGYAEMAAGFVKAGKSVLNSGHLQKGMLDVGRTFKLSGLGNDLVYQSAREEIENKIQNEKKVLKEAPKAIFNGIITDFRHVVDIENVKTFFSGSDASLGELVDYSRSAINTASNVYGGGKLLQSMAGITKVGVSGIRQAAANVGNAGLRPLAVGGYGSSVSGFSNINSAIQQVGRSGAQLVVTNSGMQNVSAGASNVGNAVEDTTRVRHYTNRKGINGIEQDGSIIAKDNNRVYVEQANKKPLGQIEAEIKYQLKPGKGRDYVEFDVPNSQLEWVKNPRYGTPELTIKGGVDELQNPTFIRRK